MKVLLKKKSVPQGVTSMNVSGSVKMTRRLPNDVFLSVEEHFGVTADVTGKDADEQRRSLRAYVQDKLWVHINLAVERASKETGEA